MTADDRLEAAREQAIPPGWDAIPDLGIPGWQFGTPLITLVVLAELHPITHDVVYKYGTDRQSVIRFDRLADEVSMGNAGSLEDACKKAEAKALQVMKFLYGCSRDLLMHVEDQDGKKAKAR